MNGVHDLGGMHGLGPIAPDPAEPLFHAEWERRAFALTLATGFLGQWNLDQSRFAREQMPPAEYLATSYYEHWLFGVEFLLQQRGLLAPGELEARVRALASGAAPAPAQPVPAGLRALPAQDVAGALRRRKGARADAPHPPRFRPGDAVRTRNDHPEGHTRLPRYARGRAGVIGADYGGWVYPDANAAGRGPDPQRCYSVLFEARELWGPSAAAGDRVALDLFEPYLEPE